MKPIIHTLLILFIFIVSSHAQQGKSMFTIALDIGHTPKKQGATSARGVGEYNFNKSVVVKLHKKLIRQGFSKAFIVNVQGKEISLKSRTQIAKNKRADLFISIHHDSVNKKYLKTWIHESKKKFYNDSFKGYSIFISDKDEKSRVFANTLGQVLLAKQFYPTLHHAEKIKGENRKLLDTKKGIYEFSQLIVLKTATFPALLFECGVILNREEELLLSNTDYQDKLASTLTIAIKQYYLKNIK